MTDFSFIEDEGLRAKAIEEYNNSLQEKIDQEVDGLKRKNEELLNEKKTTQQKYEEFKSQFGDLDPEKAKEAMELFKNTERKELLEKGKLDEYIKAEIQSKTSEVERRYNKQFEEAQLEAKTYAEKASKYESLFKEKMVDDELRDVAIKAGVEPDAIRDFILVGKSIFKYDEAEKKATAKDQNGDYIKMDDGRYLKPMEWAESQKQERKYWFPASSGIGASGSSMSASMSNDIMAKMEEAANKGNMDEYRKLRKLLKK